VLGRGRVARAWGVGRYARGAVRRRGRGVELGAEVAEGHDAQLAVDGAQRHALAEDVVADHLLLALRGGEDAALLGEALALLDVEVVFVAQRTHQAAARAADLRRVQREVLVLGDVQVHRAELGEPGRRAVLAAAAADAREALGLVAHADLLELDARAEVRGQVAHEGAEVDALLGREVERELAAVPLPLGVGDLHGERVQPHALGALPARRVVEGREVAGARLVGGGGGAQHAALRAGAVARERGGDAGAVVRRGGRVGERAVGEGAVGDAGVALERELAGRVHAAEVLAAVALDDHGRAAARRLGAVPAEEVAAVALEGDLDEVGHAER
jgi:hypothetical protein